MNTLTIQIQLEQEKPLNTELVKDMHTVVQKIRNILDGFGLVRTGVYINNKQVYLEES